MRKYQDEYDRYLARLWPYGLGAFALYGIVRFIVPSADFDGYVSWVLIPLAIVFWAMALARALAPIRPPEPPPCDDGRITVTYRIAREFYEQVETDARNAGYKDSGALFGYMHALWDWSVRARVNGGKIAAIDHEGEVISEISIDGLDNAAALRLAERQLQAAGLSGETPTVDGQPPKAA